MINESVRRNGICHYERTVANKGIQGTLVRAKGLGEPHRPKVSFETHLNGLGYSDTRKIAV